MIGFILGFFVATIAIQPVTIWGWLGVLGISLLSALWFAMVDPYSNL